MRKALAASCALFAMLPLSNATAQVGLLHGPAVSAREINWVEVPNPLQVAYIFDVLGDSRGSATVQCTFNKRRQPRNCKVVEEQYSGDGRRAGRMAELFVASTKYKGETALAGRTIVFTFDFKAAPGSL